MSNMDWLQTLLGGVSGAFTGASVANDRRSREAELARQAARQMMLDERQGENDRRAQFSQGLVDLARANELGYTEDIPRMSPVTVPMPTTAGGLLGGITNTVANGVVDTARRGPELTMPDGRKLTLDRMNTPQARAANASRAVLEARRDAQLLAERNRVDGAWQVNERTGQMVNKVTGAVRDIPGYRPTPQAPDTNANEMSEQRRFQREEGLAAAYQREQAVQDANAMATAADQIVAAARNVDNPQGDLDIIYNVVKLRDPGSVVKEGEIDLQRAARSLGTQVVTAWRKAEAGDMLTPQERADIVALVNVKVDAMRASIAPIQARYGRAAREWGADSSRVAPSPFAPARRLSNDPSDY